MTEAEGVKELLGGLWHTTTLPRYRGIIKVGAILPNPEIPDSERWWADPESPHRPYVRHLGGVSLFDLSDFDPETYNEHYPISPWRAFIPFQEGQRVAVWLEVDRSKVSASYITPKGLEERWSQEGDVGRFTFMPRIEGAHIGPLPISSLRRALLLKRSASRRLDVADTTDVASHHGTQ